MSDEGADASSAIVSVISRNAEESWLVLKNLAHCVVIAQIGGCLPCNSSLLSVFDKVFVHFYVSDNSENFQSSFEKELVVMRNIYKC